MASTNHKKFTTYQRDGESGLDYAMGRYYANTAGRFASVDPGPLVLFRPSTLNRYAYTSSDPVNKTDAAGLQEDSDETPPPPPHTYSSSARGIRKQYHPTVQEADDFKGRPAETEVVCNFPEYAGLSGAQSALLSSEDYVNLSATQKASFLNITGSLLHAGIDLSGLALQPGQFGIQQDRLLFAAGTTGVLEASVAAAIAGGTFISDQPDAGLHPGMSGFGARQNRVLNSLQVGGGPLGAFADIDRGNPKSGLFGFLVHVGEVLTPGKTNPFAVGRGLGKDITGYECRPNRAK